MENKETITTLKGISEKESKAGRKYFSVQTDEGAMTMFDKPIIDEMMKHVGKKVKLEYAEKDGFKNVKKFLGEISEEQIKSMPATAKPSTDNFEDARKLKDQSIYTSYAKDVFIEIYGRQKAMQQIGQAGETEKAIMEKAIALVKQARESFKE